MQREKIKKNTQKNIGQLYEVYFLWRNVYYHTLTITYHLTLTAKFYIQS